MANKKAKEVQTCARPPTEMSQVIYGPNVIRDTRTLAGQYLAQRPEAAERYKDK